MQLGPFLHRFKRNKTAVVGLLLVVFFTVVAVFAPFLAPHDPFQTGFKVFAPPGGEFPFGTDDLGRDVMSRTVFGTRASLLIGVVAAVAATFLGLLIGAPAGYLGRKIDDLLMRITEFFLIIPRFFLALLLVALIGRSVVVIIFVISVLSWPDTARIVRGEFLSLKERQFVEASIAQGEKLTRMIFVEVLPNCLSAIIVNTSLQIANAILTEASLSFLGLGDPLIITWGEMLRDAQDFLAQAWWMAIFPGVGIFLLVIGFNILGDGLNEALNPRLREM